MRLAEVRLDSVWTPTWLSNISNHLLRWQKEMAWKSAIAEAQTKEALHGRSKISIKW